MTFQVPRLGPGAIYLRSLDGLFRSASDLIRVAEIEPQTLSTKGTAPGSVARSSSMERRRLATFPQRFLTHGVGYPIGGTVCDQQSHIGEFLLWTEGLNAPWTSEHLSILELPGARGPQPCGFLMPPLQTDAQVELAVRNIRARAAAVGRPFAFETGVNYFSPRDCEMADGDFFAAVAESADCGILLDLTNLWVNHKNGRARIEDVIARLPLERVWEVHLAGIEFANGYWLDAHSGAIDSELAEFALEVVASLPNLGAIIFEVMPDRVSQFGAAAFLRQMEVLNRLWEAASRDPEQPVARAERPRYVCHRTPSPGDWERFLAQRMLRDSGNVGTLEARPEDERSFRLYSILASSFRAGAIAELLEHTTRLLLMGMGEPALRDLMDRYISSTPPVGFPTDEVLSFRRFMDAHPIAIPGLKDMLKFETALIESAANNALVHVTLAKDIDAMLADIAAERLPGSSSDQLPAVLEIGVDPAPFIRAL